jgi:hypothetical protein
MSMTTTRKPNRIADRLWPLTLLAALWAGLPQVAWAQDAGQSLVLALYAPLAPLPSADARFSFVDKLARQLQSAGISAQPKVFARATDLEAAIKRGQVDLAVLDAFYLAERGGNYNVLAVATASGEPYLRWGLHTHLPGNSILDLTSKRLAWVSPAGAKEATYINNVLLYGELRVAQFFTMSGPAPDISAAVSDVVLRRADCVFAPEPAVQGKSLRRVYDAGEAGRIPNPALVQVSAKVSAEVAANIRKALTSFNTTGILDGWRTTASAGEPYRQLRSRLRGRPDRSLILAEPSRGNTQVQSSMVANVETQLLLPPARGLLAPPTDLP